jgi:predicted metal-dependent hydrolase
MTQAISNFMWWTGMIEHRVAGHPVAVVRHAAARRMRLGVDPRNGRIRLTLPRRASLPAALEWAAGQRGWIEIQLAKLATPQPIVPGMVVNLAGEALVLDWKVSRPRTIRKVGGALVAGGPLDGLPARLLRFLKRHALDVLASETAETARKSQISVARVGIGDAGTRWGSCSANGDIRYSWRLILAPTDVRRATVAHEVAHRVHMNHGPAFHALVKELYGADPSPARHWLKANGAALHWFGRAS